MARTMKPVCLCKRFIGLLSAEFFNRRRILAFFQNSIVVMGLVLVAGNLASRAQITPTSRKSEWSYPITSRFELVARVDKGEEYFLMRNKESGHMRPAKELNRWLIHWNHWHLSFSKNGKWAVWRDWGGVIFLTSLDGRMIRRTWLDPADEHNDLEWKSDNKHFFIESDWEANGDRKMYPELARYTFSGTSNHRKTERLSEAYFKRKHE